MINKIIHLKETASTNGDAKKLIQEGCVDGTVVLAENQTSGRGRLGKKWISNTGLGMYCSIVYYPDCERDEFSKMTLVAGLAVAEILEELGIGNVMLKWPNDIYIDGKKCGGILCEAVLDKSRDAIIMGIGINVNHSKYDFGEDIRNRATSLKICGLNIGIEELVEKITTRTNDLADKFCRGGWLELLKRWQKRDFLAGKESEWLLNDGSVRYGIAEGINEDGLLYILTEDGSRHEVLSGDVQLKI